MKFDCPEYVNGLDIETKSEKINCFIIGIGMVTFSVRTMSIVNVTNLLIDPECQIQQVELKRDTSQNTMDWWFPEEPTEWSPSKEAQDWSWSGTLSTEQALDTLDGVFRDLNRNKNTTVHTMRGPEFDYIRLNSLYEDMGRRWDLRWSMLDSDRTVERNLKALGFSSSLSEKEIEYISPSDNFVLHVAVCDAAKEAYLTAKLYHLLWWVRNHGYDKAAEVEANMTQGIYEAIPNE